MSRDGRNNVSSLGQEQSTRQTRHSSAGKSSSQHTYKLSLDEITKKMKKPTQAQQHAVFPALP
jgi:hypothetical protein